MRLASDVRNEADVGYRINALTAGQITSAQAAYCASPGCRSSDAIQPAEPMPEVLASPMSTHVKLRIRASRSATALKTPVSVATRSLPPKSAAAGTYDQVGIDIAATRGGVSTSSTAS